VNVLFTSTFHDAAPYVFRIGVIGLGISLVNLLVQFLMAVHDRLFIPVLAGGVVLLAVLIVVFHQGVGEVVNSVLTTVLLLLVTLTAHPSSIRRTRPEPERQAAKDALVADLPRGHVRRAHVPDEAFRDKLVEVPAVSGPKRLAISQVSRTSGNQESSERESCQCGLEV